MHRQRSSLDYWSMSFNISFHSGWAAWLPTIIVANLFKSCYLIHEVGYLTISITHLHNDTCDQETPDVY